MGKHTPHLSRNRVSANGSFRIDRQILSLGIPRLQVSTGTNCVKESRHRNDLITLLIKAGEKEVLEALYHKRIDVEQLWRCYVDAGRRLNELRSLVLALQSPAELANGIVAVQRPSETLPEPRSRLIVESSAVSTSSPGSVDAFLEPIEDLRRKAEAAYRLPLWKTVLSPSAWPAPPERRRGGSKTRTRRTLRRYRISLRALQDAVRLCGLEESDLRAIALMTNEKLFHALRQLRRRGVAFEQAILWATATEEERDSMGVRNLRVGDTTLDALVECPPALVRALRALGERVPRLSTAKAVYAVRSEAEAARSAITGIISTEAARERAQDAEDAKHLLAEIGLWLHEDAQLVDLLRLQKEHWAALYLVWGATDVDWMQLRRSLMAALTTLTGSEHDPLRTRVVERIPAKKLSRRSLKITIEQYRQMLANVNEHQRDVLIAITVSGLRIEEYELLRPEWLDHNTCTIYPNGQKTEGSSDPITVAPEYWPFVVRSVPHALKRSAIRKMLRKACKAANIESIRVHDLRHCLGHFAAAGGATREELQAILRHKSPQMTEVYTSLPKVEKAAAAMANALGPLDAKSFKGSESERFGVESANHPTPGRGSALLALSREELYHRVWETAIDKLKVEFGVSDVLIHKRCRKLAIPTPPRGYWQRKAKGYSVIETPPLPPMTSAHSA